MSQSYCRLSRDFLKYSCQVRHHAYSVTSNVFDLILTLLCNTVLIFKFTFMYRFSTKKQIFFVHHWQVYNIQANTWRGATPLTSKLYMAVVIANHCKSINVLQAYNDVHPTRER